MKLTEEQKAFLVMSLARYMRPVDIMAAFAEQFGAQIARQTVHQYNPEAKGTRKVAAKWHTLHKQTRQSFLKDVENIPIAHAGYRLGRLQAMFDEFFDKKAYKGAAEILEQAAREAGGAFTNKRELSGKLKVEDETPALDSGQQRAIVAAALEQALRAYEKRPAAPTTRH